MVAGKTRWRDCEALDHTASAVKKQREDRKWSQIIKSQDLTLLGPLSTIKVPLPKVSTTFQNGNISWGPVFKSVGL